MEREALRLLILSMTASGPVADRALAIIDWAREKVTSLCPIASVEWDELLDVKIEEDAEGAVFALIAMGKCLERPDPDAALYLLLKGDDVRDFLKTKKYKFEVPFSVGPDPRPDSWGTPAAAIRVVVSKRSESLCSVHAAEKERKEKEEKEKKEREEKKPPTPKKKKSSSPPPPPPKPTKPSKASKSSSAASAATDQPLYLTKIPPKAAAVRPTWVHDGHRIVGSTAPTDETFQEGDPVQLHLGLKFLVLHD
jgi:hypothetical protein